MIDAKRLRRRSQPSARAVAIIPPGERVYAIGDVHGRLDLLNTLLHAIEADDHARGAASTAVILLGDLIDRGPYSAETIEFLLSMRPGFAAFRFIMGNHEEALLRLVAGGSAEWAADWLHYGGFATLDSYGVPQQQIDHIEAGDTGILLRYIPARHLEFIAGFRDWVQIGDYLFTHAGIRPGLPLDQQSGQDLRWIRDAFLNDRRDHGFVVVHGHSIASEPELRPNRIGIDTGAYRSGRLVALGLEGDQHWLLDVRGRENPTLEF